MPPMNPFVSQETRIKKESSYGTAPAAVDNRLQSMTISEWSPTIERSLFKPSGSRFPTISQGLDDFTGITLEGAASFTDISWVLESLFGTVTPTASGTSYARVYTQTGTELLVPISFALHYGNSSVARQALGGIFTGLSFAVEKGTELTLTSPGIAKATTLGVTGASTPPWAASPTNIAVANMSANAFDVYLDPSWATLGTTKLLYCFNFSVDFSERYMRTRPINSTGSSDNIVESEDPGISVTMKLAADATAEGFIDTYLRTGTPIFVRLLCTGKQISTGPTVLETFQMDMCLLLESMSSYASNNGVATVDLTAQVSRDTTSNNGIVTTLKNAIATVT